MTLVRNAAYSLISGAGITLIGLLTGILQARALGPVGRGLMTTVVLWPTMLAWAGEISLGFANIYFAAAEPSATRRLFANSFWAALVLGILVGVCGVFVLPCFVLLTGEQHLLLTISLLLLPLTLWADFGVTLIWGRSRFAFLSIVRACPPLITALGLFVLWKTHTLTVTTAIVATWAGGWVSFAATLWFLARERWVQFRPDMALFRRSLAYSSRIHIGTLANLANGRLDQLVMTAVVTPRALGLYAVAVTFSDLLNQAATAISMALLPQVAGEKDEETRFRLAVQSAKWTLLFGILGAIFLFCLSPQIVKVLWGNRFAEAVPTIRVLLPGTLALGLYSSMCASLRGAHKPMAGTIAELASLAVMLPLLWFLLPRFGIFGAGLASTCGYIVSFIVILHHFVATFGKNTLRGLCPNHRDWQDLCRVAVSVRSSLRRGAVAA